MIPCSSSRVKLAPIADAFEPALPALLLFEETPRRPPPPPSAAPAASLAALTPRPSCGLVAGDAERMLDARLTRIFLTSAPPPSCRPSSSSVTSWPNVSARLRNKKHDELPIVS